MKEPLQIIAEYASAGTSCREQFFSGSARLLSEAAFTAALAIAEGAKLLICGNGGSAADAQHVAGEFINRFMLDRPALPAIALTTDTSVLTAIGNDTTFERIFARQIEALGAPGDILLAISTSGRSPNILEALGAARGKKLITIGLTGANTDRMEGLCDHLISVPSDITPVIQEIHIACEHLFCRLCDYFLFENPARLGQTIADRSLTNATL